MDNNLEGKNLQKQQIAILKMDEDGISVPNWLFEVLAWITRIEMAKSSMSYSCKLFKQICFPKLHGNVKRHKITKLAFHKYRRTNSGYFLLNRRRQPLPIPNVAPPSYILGFKQIIINFLLDDQLLKFLKNILSRLNRIKFTLEIYFDEWMPHDKNTKAFRGLLNLFAKKIVKFTFDEYYGRVSEFNRLFPGFIQKVNFLCACPIPDQFDILFNWLAMPTKNGEKQKILEFEQSNENDMDKFVDRLKKEFSNATKRLNFFIICPIDYHAANFNMENRETGEILTSMDMGIYNIVRCPKGEENYWNSEGHYLWVHDDEDPINITVHI